MMAVVATYSVIGGGATTALLVCVLVFSGLIRLGVCETPAAPAVYMMGDSLVDVGNNNYLPLSIAKANFRHNGVDYPTGRFSNGQNAADFLAKKIGLPTSPPYLSLNGGVPPPITGVSFASGGAGILNGTGELLVRRQAEAGRIREKYPDRIPVIVEKAERSDIPDIDKKKLVITTRVVPQWFELELQRSSVPGGPMFKFREG